MGCNGLLWFICQTICLPLLKFEISFVVNIQKACIIFRVCPHRQVLILFCFFYFFYFQNILNFVCNVFVLISPTHPSAEHNEDYIMFSVDNSELLCIKCFRDMDK